MMRRIALVVAAVMLATIGAVGLMPSVAGAAAPVLQGTVTDSYTGLPVAAANVRVWPVGASNYSVATTTDASGHYSIATLAVGSYQVQFAKSGSYATTWWNGQAVRGSATVLVIDSSGASHEVDSTLVASNTISGTVVDTSGVAIGSVLVQLYQTGTSTLVAQMDTTAAGVFRFAVVPAGSYQMLLAPSGGFAWVWYPNATTQAASTPIVLGTTPVTVNVTLHRTYGWISGQVVDSATGLPVVGASVQVFPPGQNSPVATVTTDSNGNWNTTNWELLPGSYQISYSFLSYTTQWYHGASTQAGATAVVVTADATNATGTTRLVRTPTTGAIQGTVTDATTSAPIAGATVQVYLGSNSARTITTAADGTWSVTNLEPGTYTVFVSATGYGAEWYPNATTRATATALTVTANATITASQSLSSGATLVGTITDASTSAAIAGASVHVYPSGSSSAVASTTSGADGSWSVGGLAAGSYQVLVTAPGYASQWYLGSATQAGSTSVAVAAGATATVPVTLVAPGTITGTVTDSATGLPIAGARVQVYPYDLGPVAANVTTASNGTWAAPGLAPGNYQVLATATGYEEGWYGAGPNQSTAPSVVVTSGGTVDASTALALLPFGTLSGTIVDAQTLAPIPYSSSTVVAVYPVGSTTAVATFSGVTGWWQFSSLLAGSYQVRVVSPNYVTQWYPGVSTQSAATVFTVSPGGAVTMAGTMAMVPATGTIAGTIVAQYTGAGISGATVQIYPTGTTTPLATLTTDANGAWSTTVRAGQYQVFVSAPGYYSSWYGSNTQNGSPNVTVPPNGTGTAPPVILSASTNVGTLAGAVTDGVTGSWIVRATVSVYQTGAATPEVVFPSGFQGTWSLPYLPDGSYQVEVADPGYVTQWFSSSPTQAGSQSLIVTSNATTQVPIGLLQPPPMGVVYGTVTNAATSAVIAGATVSVYQTGSTTAAWTGTTDSSGSYASINLPIGTYQVSVAASGFITQWYLNATTQAKASTVTVSGGDTELASFALTKAPTTGTLQGTVADAGTSAAITGATVQIYPTGSTTATASTTTSSTGAWSLSGVAPGSYQVFVSAPGYLASWYGNATTQSGATSVTVTAGATTTVPKVTLTVLPSSTTAVVTGTMTDAATGKPIAGGFVRFYVKGASTFTSFTTAANGTYTATIPAGTYEVSFSEPTHLTKWWTAATVRGGDTPIVLAGGTTTTMSAALTPK